MWWEFLHHITLHFPIVLTLCMAVLAAVAATKAERAEAARPVVLWGGRGALLFTSIAVLSGLMSGGFSGGEGYLVHHRYLGVLAFLVITLAVACNEAGERRDVAGLRRYGRALWWPAALAVIGAGHWGGRLVHGDVIPF